MQFKLQNLLAIAQILQFLTLFMFTKLNNYPNIILELLKSQGIFTLDFIP